MFSEEMKQLGFCVDVEKVIFIRRERNVNWKIFFEEFDCSSNKTIQLWFQLLARYLCFIVRFFTLNSPGQLSFWMKMNMESQYGAKV